MKAELICSLLVRTMGIKLDLNAELSLTTTSICGASPVHTDGRFGARQGIRLHAGAFNVDVWLEAGIKHTRLVVDLWWDFFVAFLEHPACTRQEKSSLLPGIGGDVECDAVYFSFFPFLLALQDVTLFGVAWFCCGWDRLWRRLLFALAQCVIGYVPLGSNVGARAVNGTVWLSAVVLVVVVKGSFRRPKGNVTRFTGCSSLTQRRQCWAKVKYKVFLFLGSLVTD